MRRLPPLGAIEAFVEVGRTGSSKAAAAALALSPPALSRRLAALERFVGRPLFERRHQSLVITAEGERLMARIAPALDELAKALDGSGGAGGIIRLRLGVQPLFASQRLIPRLPELRRRHGELHIDIDTGPHMLSRLNDELDAAVLLMTATPDTSLYARRLDTNHIVAIGAPAAAARLTDPAQLAGETVLIHRDMSGTFETWREAIGLPDLQPAATDLLDSGQLMLDAAAQDLGVAFMLGSQIAGTGVTPLFGRSVPSPHNYWFVARRAAMARQPVRMFHNWLFETLGAYDEAAAAWE